MKASRSTLIGFSLILTSPLILAQSISPMTDRQPVQVAPAQNARELPTQAQSDEAEMNYDQSSSGASESAISQSSQFGSGGQLITPAIAQSRPAGTSSSVLVQPETINDVTFMCGGIGEEESNYMKQTAARDFDLMITFAAQSGHYVADVDVSIRDAGGNPVLETTCDGPLLLVDLPHAGLYRLTAQLQGHTLSRTVQVADQGRTDMVALAWPQNVVNRARMAKSDDSARPGDASSGADSGTGSGAAGAGTSDSSNNAGAGADNNGNRMPYDHPSKGIR